FCVSCVGGQTNPSRGIGKTLRDSSARDVHHAQVKLGNRFGLICSKAKPFRGLLFVLRDPATITVIEAHESLGARIPLLRQRTRKPQRSGTIASSIRLVGGFDSICRRNDACLVQDTGDGRLYRLPAHDESEARCRDGYAGRHEKLPPPALSHSAG